jgi:hypothetical protein
MNMVEKKENMKRQVSSSSFPINLQKKKAQKCFISLYNYKRNERRTSIEKSRFICSKFFFVLFLVINLYG